MVQRFVFALHKPLRLLYITHGWEAPSYFAAGFGGAESYASSADTEGNGVSFEATGRALWLKLIGLDLTEVGP